MNYGFTRNLRIIALLTALLFTSETLVQAAPLSSIEPVIQATLPLPAPPYLKLPPVEFTPDRGKIEEVFQNPDSSKSPFVYLIQDAHDSLDAQESIRALLEQLVEKDGVNFVCFEGGSKELERNFYNFSDIGKINEKVWDALLAKGEISGLERYALEAPASVKFLGIEDAKVYFENIRSIRKIFSEEEKVKEALGQIDEVFNQLSGRLVTGDLKKLRDLKKAFESGRLSLISYAKSLTKESFSQFDWPQLARISKLVEIERKLKGHEEDVKRETAVITKGRKDAWFHFLLNPKEHWKAKGELRWYFEKLIDELRARRVDPEKLIYFKNWLGFYVLQDEISAKDLFLEIERLEEKLLGRLNLSEDAKNFIRLENDYVTVNKLLNLELSRREWTHLKERKTDLKTLSKELIKLYKKSFGRVPKINIWKALKIISIFNLSRDNYGIVERRDAILSENFLEQLKGVKAGKAALIVGGFHTDKVTEFLKQRSVGYAVITPSIQNADRRLNYRARMNPDETMTVRSGRSDLTAPVVVAASLGIPEAQPYVLSLKKAAEAEMSAASTASSLGNYRQSEEEADVYNRIEILIKGGNFSAAFNLLNETIDRFPFNANFWKQKAFVHFKLKQLDDAVAASERSLQLNPHDGLMHLTYAKILRRLKRQGSLRQALYEVNQALSLKPSWAEALQLKAQIFQIFRNYDSALAAINQAIECDPSSHYLYFSKAKILMEMGKFQPALEALDGAIALKRDDIPSYTLKAQIYMEMDDLDRASETMEAGLMLNPLDVRSRVVYAQILKSMWQLEKALAVINNLIGEVPADVQNYVVKAGILKMMGHPQEALEAIGRAIHLWPDDPENYLVRAVILKDLKQEEKSIESIDTAIRMNPRFARNYALKAWISRHFGKYAEGIQIVQSALDILPQDLESLVIKALLLKKMNRSSQSLRAIKSALSIKPDYIAALLARALAVKNTKWEEEAPQYIAEFQSAIEKRKYLPVEDEFIESFAELIGAYGEETAKLREYLKAEAEVKDSAAAKAVLIKAQAASLGKDEDNEWKSDEDGASPLPEFDPLKEKIAALQQVIEGLYFKNDWPEAYEKLIELIKLRGISGEYLNISEQIVLGSVFNHMNRWHQAILLLSPVIKAMRKTKNKTDEQKQQLHTALSERGQAYLESGQYKDALGDFSQAIVYSKLGDSDLWIHEMRGLARLFNGDWRGAAEDFEDVLSKTGKGAASRVYLGLAIARYNFGQPDSERRALKQGAKIHPWNFRFVFYQAARDFERKQLSQALAKLEKAAPVYSKTDLKALYFLRGHIYLASGKTDLALEEFETVAGIEPYPNALREIAQIYEGKGEAEKARAARENAIYHERLFKASAGTGFVLRDWFPYLLAPDDTTPAEEISQNARELEDDEQAEIFRLKSIKSKNEQLRAIEKAIEEFGETIPLLLLQAKAFIHKFQRLKIKKDLWWLNQAREIYKRVLQQEPQNNEARRGSLFVERLKAEFEAGSLGKAKMSSEETPWGSAEELRGKSLWDLINQHPEREELIDAIKSEFEASVRAGKHPYHKIGKDPQTKLIPISRREVLGRMLLKEDLSHQQIIRDDWLAGLGQVLKAEVMAAASRPYRSWETLRSRFGIGIEPLTLEQTGQMFKVTREAIRQREEKTLEILQADQEHFRGMGIETVFDRLVREWSDFAQPENGADREIQSGSEEKMTEENMFERQAAQRLAVLDLILDEASGLTDTGATFENLSIDELVRITLSGAKEMKMLHLYDRYVQASTIPKKRKLERELINLSGRDMVNTEFLIEEIMWSWRFNRTQPQSKGYPVLQRYRQYLDETDSAVKSELALQLMRSILTLYKKYRNTWSRRVEKYVLKRKLKQFGLTHEVLAAAGHKFRWQIEESPEGTRKIKLAPAKVKRIPTRFTPEDEALMRRIVDREFEGFAKQTNAAVISRSSAASSLGKKKKPEPESEAENRAEHILSRPIDVLGMPSPNLYQLRCISKLLFGKEWMTIRELVYLHAIRAIIWEIAREKRITDRKKEDVDLIKRGESQISIDLNKLKDQPEVKRHVERIKQDENLMLLIKLMSRGELEAVHKTSVDQLLPVNPRTKTVFNRIKRFLLRRPAGAQITVRDLQSMHPLELKNYGKMPERQLAEIEFRLFLLGMRLGELHKERVERERKERIEQGRQGVVSFRIDESGNVVFMAPGEPGSFTTIKLPPQPPDQSSGKSLGGMSGLGGVDKKLLKTKTRVRLFFGRHPGLLQDFLAWRYRTRVIPDKIRAILIGRILADPDEEMILNAIASQFDDSRENIRQIEKRLVLGLYAFMNFENLKKLAARNMREKVLAYPVEHLDLQAGTVKVIHRRFSAKRINVSDLTEKTEEQLKKEMGFGGHHVEEIKAKLALLGLELKRAEAVPDVSKSEETEASSQSVQAAEHKNADTKKLLQDRRARLFALPVTKLGLSPEALTVLSRIPLEHLNGRTIMNFSELMRVDLDDVIRYGGAAPVFEEIREMRAKKLKETVQELDRDIKAFRGSSAGSLGVSEEAVLFVIDATGNVVGLSLKKYFPEYFEVLKAKILAEGEVDLPAELAGLVQSPEFAKVLGYLKKEEPSLVITGPVSPQALIAHLTGRGTHVLVYYDNPEYKKKIEALLSSKSAQFRDAVMKKGYFVDLSGLKTDARQFISRTLAGGKFRLDSGREFSLARIAGEAGLRGKDIRNHTVMMGEDRFIESLGQTLAPRQALLFAGGEDRSPLADVLRLSYADRLSRNSKEAQQTGLVIFDGLVYRNTDMFRALLEELTADGAAAKLTAGMA